MKRYTPLLIILLISSCSVFKSGSESASSSIFDFSNLITEEALYADLEVISHDSLQGREAGSIGEDKAASFLTKKYTEYGLTPVGDDGTHYQHFDLIQPSVQSYTYTIINESDNSTLDRSTHNSNETANLLTLFGGNDSLSGSIVFAGSGIVDEEQSVNHFPDDHEGKWLMLFYQQGVTNMQYLQRALSSGALGGILIMGNDPEEFMEEAINRQSSFGQGRGMSLKYLRTESNDQASPAFNRINPELAATLFGLKSTAKLDSLQQVINENPAGFSPQELPFSLQHEPVVDENIITSKNIVAYLEGSDPELKNEVVVLSAHYDHVGIGQPDADGDNIYNGADDDGSGTIATLHTARALAAAKKAGVGPKRSVLFLSVSAEEKGLLGSRYYSDHPIYSIDNTVANINMDMIGRVDEANVQDSTYIYIIGGEIISSGLDSLTQVANAMGPDLTLNKRYNDLSDPNQFYRRSDHWNFGRLGVPFVFLFSGVHEDYHRPSDHIEKITFGPYVQRVHLAYNLTALLANSDERPIVDNQEFIDVTRVQAR